MKILTSYIFLLSLLLGPCAAFAQDGASVSSAKRIEFSTNADPMVSPLNGARYPVDRVVPVNMTFTKDTADYIVGFSFDCRIYDPFGAQVLADTIMLSGGWDKGILDYGGFIPTQPGTYRLVFGVWDAEATYRDSIVWTIVAVGGKLPDLRFSNPGGPGTHPRRDSSYHHSPVIPIRMMVVNRSDVTSVGAMMGIVIRRGSASIFGATISTPTIGPNDSGYVETRYFDAYTQVEGTYCLSLGLRDGITQLDTADWCFSILPDPQDIPTVRLGGPTTPGVAPTADSTYLESSSIRPRFSVRNAGTKPTTTFIVRGRIFDAKGEPVFTNESNINIPIPGDSRLLGNTIFNPPDTGRYRVLYQAIFREQVIDSVSWSFNVAIDTATRSSTRFHIVEPETGARSPVKDGVYNLDALIPVSAFVVNDDSTLSGRGVTLRASISNSVGGPVYGREEYQEVIGPDATLEMKLPAFRSSLPGKFRIVMTLLRGTTTIDAEEWEFTVSQSTGVENPAEPAAGPIVRPNPARQRAIVTLRDEAGSMIAISLCDMTGAEVRRFDPPATIGPDGFDIDLRGLPAGVYMLRGISESGSTSGTRLVIMP